MEVIGDHCLRGGDHLRIVPERPATEGPLQRDNDLGSRSKVIQIDAANRRILGKFTKVTCTFNLKPQGWSPP